MKAILKSFIESLEMDSNLYESIMGGYNVIFEFNSMSPNVAPLLPPQGYVNAPKSNAIMNQMVPAGITGIGSAGSANGTGYKYEPATAEASRDLGEETRDSKWDAPNFKKYVSNPNKSIKGMIKNANNRIPRGEENVYAPTGAGSMMIGGLTTANFPAYDANLIQGGSVGTMGGSAGATASPT